MGEWENNSSCRLYYVIFCSYVKLILSLGLEVPNVFFGRKRNFPTKKLPLLQVSTGDFFLPLKRKEKFAKVY